MKIGSPAKPTGRATAVASERSEARKKLLAFLSSADRSAMPKRIARASEIRLAVPMDEQEPFDAHRSSSEPEWMLIFM
jgi:hypothetical protein